MDLFEILKREELSQKHVKEKTKKKRILNKIPVSFSSDVQLFFLLILFVLMFFFFVLLNKVYMHIYTNIFM